jgi:autotransporter-associated beta strand protein
VISGTGNLTFTGPGTLTLNAANTYTGSTVVNAGTVMLGASGSLNSATVVNVASGATFHLNGRNQTVSGLHGAGSVALGSGILTINDNSNRAHSGVISGTGAITKSGSGTLTLSATNTYSGVTRINSGTLTIGSGGSIGTSTGIHIANGANFNVASASGGFILGATQNLSGGGTITGDVTIAGSHTPGFSPGLQSFANNLSYSAGSSITWELTSNTLSGRGTNFDGIDVAGNLNFAGPTSLNLDFNLAESQVSWAGSFWNNDVTGTAGWKIFGVNGSITGFENLSLSTINWLDSNDQSLSSLRPNASFSLFQGNDGVYLNYTAVPETSTAWIVSLAGSLALLRRRRGMA